MKKIIGYVVVLFALSACSFNDVISLLVTPTVPPPPPVNTSAPTVVTTPTQTPTNTVVPTFTSTPTKAGFGNNFGAPSEGGSDPLPTLILIPTATPGPQVSLMSEPGSLIQSVTVSSDVLLWGYCRGLKYVDFDIRLASNARVTNVLLFMRLVDKGGNQSTAWGGGAIMEEVSGSHYTYRVSPENLSYYDEFKDAWIQYQIVVMTYGLNVLARSPAYRKSLSLQYCLPAEADE
jgi:hypothetical protein